MNLNNCGKVYIKKDRNYVLWQIHTIQDVYIICSIINGFIRTPKIETLSRYIHWLNEYEGKLLNDIKLSILPLDISPLDSNGWLCGLTDADGNFSINLHKRKNGNYRVQLYYALEIKQTYSHKSDYLGETNYYNILINIAEIFDSALYSRKRHIFDKDFYSYTVRSTSNQCVDLVINYFNQHPLLSSKRLNFNDWMKVREIQKKNSLTNQYLDQVIGIRKDFNKTRKTFNFDHLKI